MEGLCEDPLPPKIVIAEDVRGGWIGQINRILSVGRRGVFFFFLPTRSGPLI